MDRPTHIPPDAEERLSRALIDRAASLPFDRFERLVCRVLAAAGYPRVETLGRHHFRGRRRPGPADLRATLAAGATTVPVLVMLKRFRRPVQDRFVHELLGTMVSHGVSRGLIVTTSRFRPGAEAARRGSGAVIDLIDGQELARLMREHRIGVAVRTERVAEPDEAFFDGLGSRGEGGL
jgi:restriction system protein